jgi:hypothetical protein
LFLILALTAPLHTGLAKDKTLESPPAGKAVVYIGKMNAFVGAAWPFHFFADQQYLARVKGKKYFRYVCDPGEHLFWVAAQQRRTFVKARVEAGHSYALYAKLTAGAELIPITKESDDWKEFRGMIFGEKPMKVDPADVTEWEQDKPDYISKALAEWKTAGEPALKLLPDEFVD